MKYPQLLLSFLLLPAFTLKADDILIYQFSETSRGIKNYSEHADDNEGRQERSTVKEQCYVVIDMGAKTYAAIRYDRTAKEYSEKEAPGTNFSQFFGYEDTSGRINVDRMVLSFNGVGGEWEKVDGESGVLQTLEGISRTQRLSDSEGDAIEIEAASSLRGYNSFETIDDDDDSDEAFRASLKGSSRMNLDRRLSKEVMAVDADPSVADGVQVVKDYLESKGYTES